MITRRAFFVGCLPLVPKSPARLHLDYHEEDRVLHLSSSDRLLLDSTETVRLKSDIELGSVELQFSCGRWWELSRWDRRRP